LEAAKQVLERTKKILGRKSEDELTVGDLTGMENDQRGLDQLYDGPRVQASISESQRLLVEMQRKYLEKREEVRRIEVAVFAQNLAKAEQERKMEEKRQKEHVRRAIEKKEKEDRDSEMQRTREQYQQFEIERTRTTVFDLRYEPAARLRDIETMEKIRQQIIEECKQGRFPLKTRV